LVFRAVIADKRLATNTWVALVASGFVDASAGYRARPAAATRQRPVSRARPWAAGGGVMKGGELRIETQPTNPPKPMAMWVIVDGDTRNPVLIDPDQAKAIVDRWGQLTRDYYAATPPTTPKP
jgi:hypothetical protein